MDPLTGILVASYLFEATITSGAQQAGAIRGRAAAEFQAAQFEINADFAELAGEDAIDRGDEQAIEYQKQINAIKAKQRSSFAGQGVQVDSGTAMEIQEQTAEIGAHDVIRIKNNAWREAFGYRQEAAQGRFNAQFTRTAADSKFDTAMTESYFTLLGGGLDAGAVALSRKNSPKNPNKKTSRHSGQGGWNGGTGFEGTSGHFGTLRINDGNF